MVNLEASAQVKRTTLLGYNLVYSISSEVVLGVSCCCVLSPFISHHDSHLFAELKLCGYLCCHFFFFSFYGFMSESVCCWYVSLVVGRWVLIYDTPTSIVNGSLYFHLSSYLYLSSHLYWYLHL